MAYKMSLGGGIHRISSIPMADRGTKEIPMIPTRTA